MVNQAGLTSTVLSVFLQVITHRKAHAKVPSQALISTDFTAHDDLILALLKKIDPNLKCGICHSKVVDSAGKAVDSSGTIDAYRRGDLACLVSVGQIDEGINIPNANALLDFSLYKKKKRRCFQRAGRILRQVSDCSDAIVVSARLLTQNSGLQLTNADIVFGGKAKVTYAGYDDSSDRRLANPDVWGFAGPSDLQNGAEMISGQGACIVFPGACTRHGFCDP